MMNNCSHPANKQNGVMAVKGRPLGICQDIKEGPMTSMVYHQAPRQRNATNPSELRCLDANLHFTELDSMLLIVSLVKPLKYPLLTLKQRLHRCSPQHRGTSIRRAMQLFRPSFKHQQIQTRTGYETQPQEWITRLKKQIRNLQQVGF